MLISFEGIDGSGKTTQAQRLHDTLQAQGRQVVLTREPGGSDGAEAIRALLLSGEADRWSPIAEALLFNAARRDHVERLITPALSEGKIVITDRFADSTRVYQGVSRGAEARKLADDLHDLTIQMDPDLTFFIDVDPEQALPRTFGRTGQDEARFERLGLAFQQQLANGFRRLQEEFPNRIIRINGHESEDEVAMRVWSAFEARR